jgi:dTDP-4-dehydrorhamnose reductase
VTSPRPPGDRPELWAGVECTVNRVGDRYLDQCARSGHLQRTGDLDLFASLGVRAIRYPILWEHVAPDGLARARWRVGDERLARLRELGVRPIAGLLHHGSGPRTTSLVDPRFPERLAGYARAVAERHPWIADWTPVNEPLTTARFSGLYGHWYPHARDHRVFVRALLNELRATVLAMRAIREVIPGARLVQTDDMGRTTSTPRLGYEAEFQNARRWLSFDLLCGRVDALHPWRTHLAHGGATDDDLAFFLEHPTPPDVVGLNYYVTSDRWVDEDVDRYPEWSRGGRIEPFADVHAAIGDPEGISGHRWVLEEAWRRYGRPVALTEVHLGGAREDQLRWLAEAWEAACALRADGADVRAITVWSLLGAFDWNQLVTEERGFYEPGPFDVRAPAPRPTALAAATRALARDGRFDHPALATPGWWHRGRVLASGRTARATRQNRPAPPLVIIGATGTLGRAFARLCGERGLAHVLLSRAELDVASPRSVESALERLRPWAVVNTAGYVRVDDAETEIERCLRENAIGAVLLASACARRGIQLVTFSSDLVFDGTLGRAYVETDAVSPLGVYGRSKAEAERLVLEACPEALVVRSSSFFGPWDRYNLLTIGLSALARGERFRAASDLLVSPTYVPDLVHAALDLLLDAESGIWHLANDGAITWAELARRAASLAGLDETAVEGVPAAALNLAARRPAASPLASVRGAVMPPLASALGRYLVERDALDVPPPAGGGRTGTEETSPSRPDEREREEDGRPGAARVA